jgi:transposase
MRTLSLDMRKRILVSYDQKEGTRDEVADRYRVSLGMVKKLLQQRRRTGDIGPFHRYSGRKPIILASHHCQVQALPGQKPDLTLKELRAALALDCSPQAIHYALKKPGLTYKKDTAGQRVHAQSPQGHWHTTTILGALPLDGSTACMTIEGAADTEAIRAYVRSVLRSSLRPGNIVILDNLCPHKNESTLELIRKAGAQILFLPPIPRISTQLR